MREPSSRRSSPNAAFGYWKVTVERPLRIAGTEPEKVYKASEISKLRREGQRDPSAAAVIKKVHAAGTAADPIHGTFATAIRGKTAVVEYEPDPDLRDTEQIPLLEDGGADALLLREVLPYAKDAWYSPSTVKVGYEINFNRHFYQPQPMRSLDQITADIIALEKETEGMLTQLVGANAA